MNDFKDCYQSAVENMHMLGMKEFHIDASSCMDESRHSRWVARQMRRTMTTAFSAACLVFLCGFGTVKATDYIGNVIRVNEWGFESADAATMARNHADGISPCIISEEVKLQEEEEVVYDKASAKKDKVSPSEASAEKGETVPAEVSAGKEETVYGTEPADQMKEEAVLDDGQSPAGLEEAVPGSALEENGIAEMKALQPEEKIPGSEMKLEMTERTAETEEGEMEEIAVKSYISFDEFEKNEDIIFPQPLLITETGGEAVNVTVCGDWAMARYDIDGKVIWVERTDYAETSGHASSKVFPGGICNERQYTTEQGYVYTLVDSVKEKEEDEMQIHGAVTVGTYEAYIDFMGYTEEEAIQIIESIDLSEYE